MITRYLIPSLLVLAADVAAGAEPATPEFAKLPEPVKCYMLLSASSFEMPRGLAVDLCAGTPSAEVTLKCFIAAYMHSDDGGLGLVRGQAVNLCRTIATSTQAGVM
jgi:hypothetical protein